MYVFYGNDNLKVEWLFFSWPFAELIEIYITFISLIVLSKNKLAIKFSYCIVAICIQFQFLKLYLNSRF